MSSENEQLLVAVLQRLDRIESAISQLATARPEKDWYSTEELAAALGKSIYTVTERYCNAGRIEAEKDEASGKWQIPGHEFRRLVAGGRVRPRVK